MMTFEMQIECDNAAFEGEDLGPEIARILRVEADGLESRGAQLETRSLFDENGNRVGQVVLSP